ncbi:hypothetical protein [Lysinibacillus sp. NPDC056232]|uniref:hypothetical protein n=1 Tax=Lysinibacillus sp. NPDC056232 TaxID=3345756 RepID=UPI0035DC3D2F
MRESVVQRSDSNSTDVGHEGVITGRDGFSLRSSIADPQGVAQSPLQSTYKKGVHFNKFHPETFSDELCNTKIMYAFVLRKKADRSFGKNKILVLTEKKSMFILCNNDGN